MHCEAPELTYREKNARFQIYLMGRREARQGRPLRIGHDLDTTSQHYYRKGYREWRERNG